MPVSKSELVNAAMEILTERFEDGMGICVKCGYEQYGVEPDAEKYNCDDCDKKAVYGAEQIILLLA
jgi:hypothetical protein